MLKMLKMLSNFNQLFLQDNNIYTLVCIRVMNNDQNLLAEDIF